MLTCIIFCCLLLHLFPSLLGAIADELKAWLVRAENIDLQRLANIEASVLNKFPDFHRFEDFGYGSFLTFLTARKELLEAIEEVGGLPVTRSGGLRSRLGHHVSLTSVLDFISQCGPQASPVSCLYTEYFVEAFS